MKLKGSPFFYVAVCLVSVFVFFGTGFAATPLDIVQAKEGDTPIEVAADNLEYVKNEKKIIAKGNVVIVYQAAKLTADYVEVYTDTKKAYAEGHVTIFNQGGMLRGEKVFYNFKTHQGSFPNGTAIQYPWFGYAEQMDQVSKDKVQLYNALLTTCPLDAGDPHYEVTAKRAIVYPGDRFIAYDVKFKIFGHTVFWLPYLNIPLDLDDPPLTLQPGHSTDWGWYMLSSKTFSLTKNINLRLHADYYSKRGFGGGGDVFYGFETLRTTGIVKLYGIQDRYSPASSNINSEGQDNPYRDRQKKNRYRISVRNRTDFDDYSSVILQYHKFSDEFFLHDFFEQEYRAEIQPRSYGVITRNTERLGLFAHANVQTNNFYDTTEALPQLRFDWNRQRIGRSKLFYESQTGAANFKKISASDDTTEEAWRFDTFHELSLPFRWNEVQIVPSVGLRPTYYSSHKDGGAKVRFNASAGIDFKTQYARTYDWSGELLGMEFNKIRHIAEPSIGFHDTESFGPKVKKLYQFDPIDELGDRREMVIGLENRIQTKRLYKGEMKRVDVVSLNTYLFFNAKTDRPGIEEMVGFTTFRTEVTFRPYDWLAFELENDFNLKSMEVDVSNFDLILSYKDRFSILLGHRYVADVGPMQSSNQVVVDVNVKLNSRWEAGGYARAELSKGHLEEWELRMTRDLSCGWFLDLGLNVRNDDIQPGNNYSLYARITLVPIGFSTGTGARATFANPRIGDRIAGGESTNFTRDILGRMWHRNYRPNYNRI